MNSTPIYGDAVRNASYKPSVKELRMSNLTNSYSWEKKYEVVTQMLACGNARLVSSLTGVSPMTITSWKKQPWWSDLEREIKAEEHIKLNTKLSKIIAKSLAVVEDRLENGNTKMTKDGSLVQVPVELKDAAKVTNDLLSRQHVLEKTMEGGLVETASIQDTLEALKKEFSKWASTERKKEAIDIIPKEQNAIHEEREEGLQEGSGSLHE